MSTEQERRIVVEGLGPGRRWVVQERRGGEWAPVGSFDDELAALQSSAMRTGRPPLRQRVPTGRPAVAAPALLAGAAVLVRRLLR